MEPTVAESRVLDHVARGKCNKEIAKALFIEVSTVKPAHSGLTDHPVRG